MRQFAVIAVLALSVAARGAETPTREERSASARRRWGARDDEEPWARELRSKLESATVTFTFDGVPFTGAVREVAKQAGANVVVDPEFVAKRGDNPIFLALTDISAILALDWITRLVDGGFTYEHGVALVTFTERCHDRITRVYDLRSILEPAPDGAPPAIDLAGFVDETRRAPPVETDETVAESRKELTVQLVAGSIYQTIEPGTWEKELDTFIEERGSVLVIRHRPETHERIREFLEWFDGTVNLQVRVEARVISLDEELASRVLDAAGAGPGTVYLKEPQLEALERELATGRHARIERVMNLSCYNGQRSSVLDGHTSARDGRTSFRGWVFDAMPIASFDRRYVRVDLRISRYADMAGGVGLWRFDCTTRCLDGDTVLVGAATASDAGGKRGRRLFALVTPRILYLEPSGPAASSSDEEE